MILYYFLYIFSIIITNNCNCPDDIKENVKFTKKVIEDPDIIEDLLKDTSFIYKMESFYPKRKDHIESIIDFIEEHFDEDYFEDELIEVNINCEWIGSGRRNHWKDSLEFDTKNSQVRDI